MLRAARDSATSRPMRPVDARQATVASVRQIAGYGRDGGAEKIPRRSSASAFLTKGLVLVTGPTDPASRRRSSPSSTSSTAAATITSSPSKTRSSSCTRTRAASSRSGRCTSTRSHSSRRSGRHCAKTRTSSSCGVAARTWRPSRSRIEKPRRPVTLVFGTLHTTTAAAPWIASSTSSRGPPGQIRVMLAESLKA